MWLWTIVVLFQEQHFKSTNFFSALCFWESCVFFPSSSSTSLLLTVQVLLMMLLLWQGMSWHEAGSLKIPWVFHTSLKLISTAFKYEFLIENIQSLHFNHYFYFWPSFFKKKSYISYSQTCKLPNPAFFPAGMVCVILHIRVFDLISDILKWSKVHLKQIRLLKG